MEAISGWYPGFGEVETIRRMSPFTRDFIRDASVEDPDFLGSYVIPIIQNERDPEGRILSDLSDAIIAYDLCENGLGDLDGNLGNLGKSFLKKVGKAIKSAAKTVAKVTKKVALAPIKATEQAAKFTAREIKKEEKVISKTWQKYGNIIVQVAGAVLAPFTGGASLAAAAAITAGNTLYQKKRAADQAHKANAANAAAVSADAAAAERQTTSQVDSFYSQNQQWFVSNLGVTPDKWAQLTLQQKIDLINSGAQGRPPSGTPAEPPPIPSGGASAPPSGGGGGGYAPSGGGGGGGGGGAPDEGYSPPGAQQPGQRVAQAGMFDSSMLPLLAVGAGLALIFGKSVKGGRRRAKRNPGRRRRRAA